jgi:ribonuclease J
MGRNIPLHFLPLGGSGEIGMNLNLYEYDGSWLMCDLGVSFAGEELPGIDLIMPDPSFIAERREKLVGLVLTHAHEDHLGAVPFLWPRLRCPVYATPFTAALLRRKLEEGAEGIEDMEITEVPLGGTIDLAPFQIELISLNHSIPEPNALAIHTPAGCVLHTGDWKIDPKPLIGDTADEAALRSLGDEGVLAMVCDSTNVFQPGHSGSEADVRTGLDKLIGGLQGRVAVTTFASNLARLLTVFEVAARHSRSVAVVGRSMWRILDCARETGYLPRHIHFLSDRDALDLPADKVLYLTTGCQGEPNAALSRIANRTHPVVELERGDTVIFSSKIIPGNERPIYDLVNLLTDLGIEVMTEKDHFVHVSGHPNRDELATMYQWVRPKIAVPVHGEARHLREHASLARELQVPEAVTISNGAMLRLAPGKPKIVDHVPHGRLAWSGSGTVPVDGIVVRERKRLMYNGAAFVTVVIDRKGELMADPTISSHGLFEDDDEEDAVLDGVIDEVIDMIETMPKPGRLDDESLEEAVRSTARRCLREELGRRPVVDVQLVRI